VPQGEHDAERLDLTDRERTDAVFERQLPTLAQLVDERRIPSRIEGGRVGDHLPDAHPRIADDFLRDVAEAGFGFGGEVPGVVAANGGGAAGGAQQTERAFDKRRFAAAILTEQAEDSAGGDFEIDAAKNFFAVEVFLELVDLDHGRFFWGEEFWECG